MSALAQFIIFATFLSPGTACFAATLVDAERSVPDYKVLREPYDLSRGIYKGATRISVEKNRICLGDEYRVLVSFKNTSKAAFDVLNPSLTSDSSMMVAVVAIFDSEKRYIGNLLSPVVTGRLSSELNFSHWCRIEAGKERVRPVHCVAGVVGGTIYRHPTRQGLLPGKYYVQAVYLDYFATSCPWYQPANPCGTHNGLRDDRGEIQLPPEPVQRMQKHDDERISRLLQKWLMKYEGSELFRSNILEIEFLPAPVEAPKPSRVGPAKVSRRLFLEGE